MSAIEFLKKLPAALKADAADGMDCTLQLNVSSPLVVKISEGVCTVEEGVAEAPDVSLTLSDDNLIALLTGKLAGAMAFMTGKLKIDGDIMLAKEIPDLFDAAKLA